MKGGIWPVQAIARAIAGGVVTGREPAKGQLQPASLDLRLGGTAYRTEASFLPCRGHTVSQRLAEMGARPMDITEGAVLERGCVHVVRLEEGLRLPPGVSARANPKSTTGRLDVFVRMIADDGERFDEVPAGYDGPLWAEVVPRSFAVVVRRGTTLNQLRFRQEGEGLVTRREVLTVDLSQAGEDAPGACGWRARRSTGIVDVDRVGAHPRDRFWDRVPAGASLVMDVDDLYILRSAEEVVASPDEAAEVIAYDGSLGEIRNHAAGFIDPGFGDPSIGASPARLVFEARCSGLPFLLRHGQTMATAVYERMLERPEALYGSGGSSYQSQGLRLAKQFC